MRLAALFLALLSLACRTPEPQPPAPPIPPLPAETPPPLPERPFNVAQVSGRVVYAIGLSLDGPVVSAWGAGADCRPSGEPVVVTANGGAFALAIERGVGPVEFGCVMVEARAGGSVVRAERPAVFAAPSDEGNRVELELQLPRVPELTRAEADRLVGRLVDAIRGDESAIAEIDDYIRGDRQRVHAALDAYRAYLRGVQTVAFEDGEGTSGPGGAGTQWMRFRLTGVAGRSVTTSVYRETLVELHGPLIDYGDRSSAFVRRILEVAHQGDPGRMARVLTADDEDVPLAAAQRVIDRLRAKFDLPRANAVLISVDERANALHYRVSGPSREGRLEEEILVVGYGDGLVGLRNM